MSDSLADPSPRWERDGRIIWDTSRIRSLGSIGMFDRNTDAERAVTAVNERDALLADRDALAARVEAVKALHTPLMCYPDADRCAHADDENHETEHTVDGDLVCVTTPGTPYDPPSCRECRDPYGDPEPSPCPTIRALEGES